MLMSAQELLADSREQAAAVSSYIDALKEFWTAHAQLEAALGVRLGAGTREQGTRRMTSRRNFITGAGAAMVGASLVSKAGSRRHPRSPGPERRPAPRLPWRRRTAVPTTRWSR
jgi:hypothetical protein